MGMARRLGWPVPQADGACSMIHGHSGVPVWVGLTDQATGSLTASNPGEGDELTRSRQPRGPWAPPGLTARALGRPERTVRTWARRGIIRSMVVSGELLVHWIDAISASEARPRRLPRSAA